MAQEPIPEDAQEYGAEVAAENDEAALQAASTVGLQSDLEAQEVVAPPPEEGDETEEPEPRLRPGLPQASNFMQALSPNLLFNRDKRKSPGEEDLDVSLLFEPLQLLPGASTLTKTIFNRLRG